MLGNSEIKHIIFDFDGVLYAPRAGDFGKGLNTDLINWIRENKNNYTFSILSNSGSFLDGLLERLRIREDFVNVYNSDKIGFLKPDPRIFSYVLTDLGVEPSECLFVDDLEANIASAKFLGFCTILFSDNEQLFTELKDSGVILKGNEDTKEY